MQGFYLVNTPPPTPTRPYRRVHLLDSARARMIYMHVFVLTYVAQSFYSSIMSNNIKLEGKEVDSLSLSTYVTCARKYGDQIFQVICLAAEDVNTRNNQSFAS